MVKTNKKNKAVFYGILAGAALILFFISFVSIFQGFNFALLSFLSLKYWIIALAMGFGVQVGLYSSIKHSLETNAAVAGSGTMSAGSMVACCAHFLANLIPIIGIAGLAAFFVKYQTTFLGVGILFNLIGINIMLKHKKKMETKWGLSH